MSGNGMTNVNPEAVWDAAVELAARAEVLRSHWREAQAVIEGEHAARRWTHDQPGQAFERSYLADAQSTLESIGALLGEARDNAELAGTSSRDTQDDDEAVAEGLRALGEPGPIR